VINIEKTTKVIRSILLVMNANKVLKTNLGIRLDVNYLLVLNFIDEKAKDSALQ